MGQSSYVKIYEALYKTKQIQGFIEGIRAKLGEVHVVDVEFSLIRPDKVGEPAQAEPRYKVTVPTGTATTGSGQIWISLGINNSSMKPFVDELFGVKGGVPTYFCKKSVVNGDEHHKRAESFANWLESKVKGLLKDEIEAAQARVLQEVREWGQSEVVARKQKEFLAAAAMEDIKKVLAAYDHLGKDVLKAALDEFLVHSIFEFEVDDV